jgi:hypothetical protein
LGWISIALGEEEEDAEEGHEEEEDVNERHEERHKKDDKEEKKENWRVRERISGTI